MNNGSPAVIGLVAHVDAGKTTLSEEILYQSGALRQKGRVDHGDAFLDTDVQEKERGITIFSKLARFSFRDRPFILLDTPGHVDFSGETERALSVMDAAVLVISAADGVQSHTRTLWRLLAGHGVPVFLFINKLDQQGTDRAGTVRELCRELDGACVDMESEDRMEELALTGEEALREVLETGSVRDETLAELVLKRKLFPVFGGAALKGEGIQALLNGLFSLLPAPRYPAGFGARVYKIARDPSGARLTFLRVLGGTLRVRDILPGVNGGPGEKVNQLRLYSGSRYQTCDLAPAGEIAAVLGPENTRAGDALGTARAGAETALTPVLSYRVQLPPDTDPQRALQAFRQLEEEDPQLHVSWLSQIRRIQVEIMGEVQLEILSRLLRDRWHMEVSFTEGGVLYRETIANTVMGAGHYEPLRHYAEVHLRLSPGERGSGVTVKSECPEDELAVNWQRLIMTHVMERRHLGVLIGAPLTDVSVTLVAGRAHLKHTEGGDFRQATYRAIRQGLMQAQSVLLEPWYSVRLEVPTECIGRALNDLTAMGGQAEVSGSSERTSLIVGRAPVSRARHYAREVAAYTHGLGSLGLEFCGYCPHPDQESVRLAVGYDPERDTDNPADSVFCSHGAGVIVPWREAAAHMHLQPGSGVRAAAEDDRPAARQKAQTPRDALEEDRELMSIFEHTYGPISRRQILPAARRPREEEKVILRDVPEEYLLVDGYNIVFAWDELKSLARIDLDAARTQLIDLMCDFNGVRSLHLILVFDAYKVPGGREKVERVGNIDVVYTREAETADAYIERTANSLTGNRRVRVATSDGMEQLIILAGGALRISAREFRREVEAVQGEIARFLRRNQARLPGEQVALALREALDALKADREV